MDFLRRLFGGERSQPVDADEMVIEGLRGAGADLSRPREVIHYLYFPTEETTRTAVAALDRDDRFLHAVIDPETGKSSVKVTHTRGRHARRDPSAPRGVRGRRASGRW